MPTLEAACLLRIYIGENDRTAGVPTYEAIVRRARETHLAGATVLRGPMGFGHDSRIHTAKLSHGNGSKVTRLGSRLTLPRPSA